MADQKGTGKHPHKSTEEPYPHNEGQSGKKQQTSGGESGGGKQSGSSSDDLKEREYRDEKGEVHHHTRTSKEMKDK